MAFENERLYKNRDKSSKMVSDAEYPQKIGIFNSYLLFWELLLVKSSITRVKWVKYRVAIQKSVPSKSRVASKAVIQAVE